MVKHKKSLLDVVRTFVGSNWFFGITLVIFLFEATWIALSARYPQAFDEQFHFGLIRLYSEHLSPFLNVQPQEAGQFGAVARDPSYLYHYLMSFPYRAIRLIISDTMTQITILRLLNILFLASSLFIFRRVLRFTRSPASLIHFSLFAFVLTPVTPLLAAHINYDNVLIPLVGLSIWMTLRLRQALHTRRVDLAAVLLLVSVWLLGSILKYAFLTVAGAECISLIIIWWQQRRGVCLAVKTDTIKQKVRLTMLLFLTLTSLVLFGQRYLVNLVNYYTLTPECDQVLSVEECQDYGPWARNYRYHNEKVASPSLIDVAGYPFNWIYRVMSELVFTIGSSYNQRGSIDYYTGRQLISMEVLGWLIFAIGIVCGLLNSRWLWQQTIFRIFGFITLCYVAALFGQNFLDYLHLNQVTAVHGRYLLPFLPLIYLYIAMVTARSAKRLRFVPAQAVPLLAIIAGLLLVSQGGFMTYILRQDQYWLRENTTVIKVNQTAKEVVRTFTIDVPKQQ